MRCLVRGYFKKSMALVFPIFADFLVFTQSGSLADRESKAHRYIDMSTLRLHGYFQGVFLEAISWEEIT